MARIAAASIVARAAGGCSMLASSRSPTTRIAGTAWSSFSARAAAAGISAQAAAVSR
ncbi:MAG: hypothetical protein WDN24_14360 [Sphingomonas sp.]